MKMLNLLILLSTVLYAHPHTFIDVYPTLIKDKEYVKQLDVKWLMDEMTSSMLVMEFDQNGNGKIDKSENDYIEKNYFLSLEDYGFYTDLPCRYKVSNFKAYIVKNRIEYDFSIIPFKKLKVKGFEVKFYDEDFFVAMQLKKEFVTQKIPHKVEDLDGDWYYGYKITYK